MPNIRMPDGTIIRNVPSGTTKDQLLAVMQKKQAMDKSVQNASSVTTPPLDNSNTSKAVGANNVPDWQKFGIAAMQGVTLNNLDEIVGGISAIPSLFTGGDTKGDYEHARDVIRGADEQLKKDYPIASTATSVAASLPVSMVMPVAKLPSLGAGVVANATRAAATAAPYGAVSALGSTEANDAGNILGDVAEGAAISGVFGGASSGVASGAGGIYKRLAGAFGGKNQSETFAQQKVAEAIARDIPEGGVFGVGNSSGIDKAIARQAKLGGTSTIADSAGINTKQLLDTVVEMPGTSSNGLARLLRQRISKRGERLVSSADDALNNSGKQFISTVDDLIAKRSADAKPFYDQVRNLSVPVDAELKDILRRTNRFFKDAEAQSQVRGQFDTPLSVALKDNFSGSVSFQKLDNLKRSLDDAIISLQRSGGMSMAAGITEAKALLIRKLEAASPIDSATGLPVYKLARDAYSTPSRLIEAAEMGKKSLIGAGINNKEISRLDADQLEAFRVGLVQALKEKTGTQSGQTELLGFWKTPAISQKLKIAFGGDYNKFKAALLREDQLKSLQSVGQGSATFRRQMAEQDLSREVFGDISEMTAFAKTGNVKGMLDSARKLYTRTELPEPVRNEIGRILLLNGTAARDELKKMTVLLNRIQAQRAKNATNIGKVIGSNVGGSLSGD
jgi:hypothetical protein